MKCLRMRIIDTMVLISHFITIYSLQSTQNKSIESATFTDGEKSSDSHVCSNVSTIRDFTLTDFAINCKPLENFDVNEENVLRRACLVAKDILSFICHNKVELDKEKLKGAIDQLCPFNFTHLEQLGFTNSTDKLLKELTNADHCSQICHDLYSNKTQCVVLHRLNSYLEAYRTPETVEKDATSKVSSQLISQKTEPASEQQNDPVTQQEKNRQSILTKESLVFNATKTVIDEVKMLRPSTADTKSIVGPTKSEVSSLKNDNFSQDNEEFKNEDINEDEEVVEEDLEEKSSLDGLKTMKTDINVVANSQRVEDSLPKVDLEPRVKEIYSGEGFFQAEDSHFFFYFIMVSSVVVIGYLAFHNKNKILAYALEGTSGRRSRRRPNPARYRKLETNLEEVISSASTNAAASTVVY